MENRRTFGRSAWLGLALSACLAQACATVKAPTLAVDGLKVGDMGLTGVAIDVRFRVRNPNPEPLNIDRLEYELFLNGNRLGRGFEAKGLQLAGFGEGKVESRFDVNFLSLPAVVKDLLRQDRVKAHVKGDFYTSGHYGSRRLGFDADADVDLQGR